MCILSIPVQNLSIQLKLQGIEVLINLNGVLYYPFKTIYSVAEKTDSSQV